MIPLSGIDAPAPAADIHILASVHQKGRRADIGILCIAGTKIGRIDNTGEIRLQLRDELFPAALIVIGVEWGIDYRYHGIGGTRDIWIARFVETYPINDIHRYVPLPIFVTNPLNHISQ